ncbi:AF4/FMR2 family member 1 [Plutella xylostella]|uniref:AF4/FMR2 family member 1 n=1 Tax=Plutella xylostella TaxID=51655 RepID=UPI00203254A9|nr:AF4/FMR2 family member 1 [Plutella xylostella]
MHMCYERPGVVTPLNGAVGYDKWAGGGGGGSAAGGAGAWGGRERERERERERQARAHQMSQSQAPEPDASALFPAPVKVTGNKDRVSQQIQIKLGDYHLAQTLLDDPSKSIGICAEPPSPAPCLPPSRRESEFKKPSHAPQNGRVHHRPFYKVKESRNASDIPGSTAAPAHRPPPLRIPNGTLHQNTIESSQPPIESILKEMKSLPTPLSVLAQTPRKELDNKFIFNHYTNKVQENPQASSNDVKPPLPKPTGLDNRISNSITVNSPDVVTKELGLSESDDEAAAATTRLHPILSPIGSGGSPSSDSESSRSDSESESSSESSAAPPPPPADQAPTPRDSWSLSNFAPPNAQLPDRAFEAGKDIAHALADVKGKPSPISELSDSEASSPSPGHRRRRSVKPQSPSSDEDAEQPSPRAQPAQAPAKRGRPPKARTSEERPPKKKRGRPPKVRAPTPPPASPPAPSSGESEGEAPPPPQPQPLVDMKSHIFRKVFTPRKGDEGGGKGGKGGKGKGGKGKGQVTIIEVTAPESGADDEERRHRDRSDERRKNEEAIAARLSPPTEDSARRRDRNSHSRITERRSAERTERSDRLSFDRIPDRRSTERTDRLSSDRTERLPSIPSDRISIPATDRLSTEKLDRLSTDKLDRLSTDKLDRLSVDKLDRRSSVERRSADRVQERYVKAEADVGSGLMKSVGSERLSETSINGRRPPPRLLVRVPLARLRGDTVRRVRAPPRPAAPPASPPSGDNQQAFIGRVPADYTDAPLDSLGVIPPGRRPPPPPRLLVRVPLARLRGDTVRRVRAPPRPAAPPASPPTGDNQQSGSVGATNHERARAASPPPGSLADVLSDDERDHKHYLSEAARLRKTAEREQEPLQRVMLYLESVLCFVRTGEVLEQELDTKRAFTIYRETIEYIKIIHSMPQRFRASPHSTFNKLDILSLRVQSLLYLRMFKMYNREVKEYHKIVQEYQQKVCAKPAHPESVSPLSPTPSPAGSVGSVGSGSASSGYCSLVHSVPASAHNALLQLTKYYTFLYVAHDLWEHADTLCRQPPNQDLFVAVDRKCGPLTLFSTFRHLVGYVRHAISLLKQAPRE